MCNTTVTKYLLFFFNLLFWLIGLFLLGIGVWALIDSDSFVNTITQVEGEGKPEVQILTYVTLMSWVVVALGGIITIIALFGCCGAIRESRCCLGVFFTLLLICFLVTVVFGGFLLFVAATGKSTDATSSEVRNAFNDLVGFVWSSWTKEQRSKFEKAHKCCGMDASLGSIASNAECVTASLPTLQTENCKSKLIESVQNSFFLSGGIILGIAVIEVVGMTMACILFNRYAHVYTAV